MVTPASLRATKAGGLWASLAEKLRQAMPEGPWLGSDPRGGGDRSWQAQARGGLCSTCHPVPAEPG